jgi:hypothetical protein
MQIIQLERITRLGLLGEELATERLEGEGFKVQNLNKQRANFPFADLLATKDGVRYFIGVKARNENRQGNVKVNESYNLAKVPDPVNARLKAEGKTTDQITAMLLAEVNKLAAAHNATAAWVTLPLRPLAGTYSAYFGTVAQLGNKRSVLMSPKQCATYRCLARDISDVRVTPTLLNI